MGRTTKSEANKGRLTPRLDRRDNTSNFRVVIIGIGELIGVDLDVQTIPLGNSR
jgi:hypothetical protein